MEHHRVRVLPRRRARARPIDWPADVFVPRKTGGPKVQRWRERMNGVQKVICGGCNLNRDIDYLARETGFAFDQLDEYDVEGQPTGFMRQGSKGH